MFSISGDGEQGYLGGGRIFEICELSYPGNFIESRVKCSFFFLRLR